MADARYRNHYKLAGAVRPGTRNPQALKTVFGCQRATKGFAAENEAALLSRYLKEMMDDDFSRGNGLVPLVIKTPLPTQVVSKGLHKKISMR
jgi:hypothetical protein